MHAVPVRAVPTTQPGMARSAPPAQGVAASAEQARAVLPHLPPQPQVWAMDSGGCVVRPGPRLVDGVEALAALLHGVGPIDPTVAVRVR